MTRLDLPGEIDVWQVDLDKSAATLALLSADERARAERFRFPQDRRRYIACRTALRQLLGDAVGKPPESLTFHYGPHGKPEAEIPFSVSHSGPRALIALGGTAPLGVDIELLRTNLDPLSLGRLVYTPLELETLTALPAAERHEAFFAAWTQKEAVLKAEGGGLSSPLLQRTVWPMPEPWLEEHYRVQALAVGPGVAAALAVELTRVPERA